ncbi:MAG TPA: hypothetical protein VK735_18550 [Pseudonocardia sp.]|uniref:hypothetical protein n=1 Tax=Pseudonocardia sp. TaxID=60912 RepID=UPI002CE79D4B|nr:hypothetical protein [Pseudonocardia sp.]HTF49447.1 hypothetical protein [Pseudonocardia sp.]
MTTGLTIYTVTYLDRRTGEIVGWHRLGGGRRYDRGQAPKPEPLVIEFDWDYFDTGPITVDVEYEPGHAWTAYAGPRRNGAE